ncbi:MAG: hypothetical protein MUC81_08350 [Bacteroidia bacterium]|jgi:hypothetical protein|nr:hypothetical protein [Bacteroidia bacterium]
MFKQLDWKYVGLAALLFAGAINSYVFRSQILIGLKNFFETENLNYFAGGIATIFMLTHKIKMRKFKFSASMSFNEFRIPVEDILSFIGNPITLVCSISLAKGLFLQTADSVQYFPFFQSLELTFIGLVTAYLIFISVMELLNNIKETILNGTSKTEQPTAIPEKEITKEAPKPE